MHCNRCFFIERISIIQDLFKYKHIRYYDIKCGLIAHPQGLMGESVAFFLFQFDLLHSTGTEHIMYLEFVKYKQYLTRGIEHYVEKMENLWAWASSCVVRAALFWFCFLVLRTSRRTKALTQVSLDQKKREASLFCSSRLMFKKAFPISVAKPYLRQRNRRKIVVKSLVIGGPGNRLSLRLGCSWDCRQLHSYTTRIGVVADSLNTAWCGR